MLFDVQIGFERKREKAKGPARSRLRRGRYGDTAPRPLLRKPRPEAQRRGLTDCCSRPAPQLLFSTPAQVPSRDWAAETAGALRPRRYVAAAQGTDTIEVAYLDGMDTPYLEQQEGFTVDGIAWKVRIDAGVAALDYRGLVKSSGA